MKKSQRFVISTLRTAMNEGVPAAAKKSGVSDATIYDWCQKAGVKPAKTAQKIDWAHIHEVVTKNKASIN
jgi:transposase